MVDPQPQPQQPIDAAPQPRPLADVQPAQNGVDPGLAGLQGGIRVDGENTLVPVQQAKASLWRRFGEALINAIPQAIQWLVGSVGAFGRVKATLMVVGGSWMAAGKFKLTGSASQSFEGLAELTGPPTAQVAIICGTILLLAYLNLRSKLSDDGRKDHRSDDFFAILRDPNASPETQLWAREQIEKQK